MTAFEPLAFSPNRLRIILRDDPTCNCGRDHEYHQYWLNHTQYIEYAPMMEVRADLRAQIASTMLDTMLTTLVQTLSHHDKIAILAGDPWPDHPLIATQLS
jgi:hypothetical protein